MTDILENIETI